MNERLTKYEIILLKMMRKEAYMDYRNTIGEYKNMAKTYLDLINKNNIKIIDLKHIAITNTIDAVAYLLKHGYTTDEFKNMFREFKTKLEKI